MEARTPGDKYRKHRRGIATKLADIQRELETLSERVQAALRVQSDRQQEAPDDRRR